MDININIDGIINHLKTGSQLAVEQLGRLAHHTVRVLKQVLVHVRQDARLAGAGFAIANIILLEITFRVANLADYMCFARLFGPEEDRNEKMSLNHGYVILTLFSSLMVGSNFALYRWIRPPLSPSIAVAVSVTACISYALLRLGIASKSEAKSQVKDSLVKTETS